MSEQEFEISELRKRILARAEELFLEFGYSKVTMEEIASSLSISKKTLYKEFANKEAILRELIARIKQSIHTYIDNLLGNSEIGFIEKLEKILSFIARQSKMLNSNLAQDLMKNFPEVWCDIRDFQQKHAYERVSELMRQGREQGFIRDDINLEIIVMSYVGAVHYVLNPASLSKLPVGSAQAFANLVKVIYEGILTPEGRNSYSTDHLSKIALEQK